MERTRRGWYEREEKAKVTLDWVRVNCHLTEREMVLIRTVAKRLMVRRDHLEVMVEGYRDIPKRTNVINRSIKKLFEKNVLDKVHEEKEWGAGNKPAILALDKAGAVLLEIPFKRRFEHEKRIIKGKEYIFRSLPANFWHVNAVNQLEVDTILVGLDRGWDIKVWNLEEQNTKKFSHQDQKYILRPDVFTMITTPENNIEYFFIEYDTGSENPGYWKTVPRLEEKIEKYRIYKHLGLWKNELWCKRLAKPVFPPVLFVTEIEKRIPTVIELCKEAGLRSSCITPDQYDDYLRSL